MATGIFTEHAVSSVHDGDVNKLRLWLKLKRSMNRRKGWPLAARTCHGLTETEVVTNVALFRDKMLNPTNSHLALNKGKSSTGVKPWSQLPPEIVKCVYLFSPIPTFTFISLQAHRHTLYPRRVYF